MVQLEVLKIICTHGSIRQNKWKWKSLSRVQLSATPRTVQSMEFSRPEYWIPEYLSLLQGIFPTQGLNPGLPHCRQILYKLSYKGSLSGKAYYWIFLSPQKFSCGTIYFNTHQTIHFKRVNCTLKSFMVCELYFLKICSIFICSLTSRNNRGWHNFFHHM